MRWKLALIAILAVIAVVVASIEFQLWNPRRAAVEARYIADDSRFINIDGLRLHYKVTGQGPAVLLWHGNFGSLDFYDGWVEALSDRYRLIRFDVNGYGLSGPDEKTDFTIERRLMIARTLLDELGVDRYFVVGTSFAAPMAYRDAAERPERVLGLMLANAGGLPRAPGGEINQPLPNPVRQWLRERYRSRGFWQGVANNLHYNDEIVTPELVERFFLMNNMRGRGPDNAVGLKHFQIGDAPGYLASVTQPTLVLWGGASILPYSEADRYEAYLENAPVRVVKIDGLGHMFAEDDPELTAGLFDNFARLVLEGTWPEDGENAVAEVAAE
ncbi:MAG: alpha/beta hydrolase [Gammaproteobacteria bacterium]|nr:alpha/beta hydrolase [Gammaproteobacteria bacterium]